MSDPADGTDMPDLARVYPPWVELAALAMTAEYCAVYGISADLDVRYIHYHALAVVLAEEHSRELPS